MKKRFFYSAILLLLALLSFGQGGYTPIPKLKITTTPDTNNSTTEVLVRDATTGNVGKVNKLNLVGTLDSVTDAGATTNNVISTGGVGINTTTPQAIFDVVSTTSGVLIPRMTTTQRNAIVTPINSMLIYNSTANQFEYYKFGSWISLTDSTTVSNLQTVTDSGATTTNNITIQGGEDDGVVTLFKNDETANVSVEWAENKVALSAKDNAVNFGDTNLKSLSGGISTQPNQNYVLPDKATGSYTLSTTSDLESGYIPLTGTTTGNNISGNLILEDGVSVLPAVGGGGMYIGDVEKGAIQITENGTLLVQANYNILFEGFSGFSDYSNINPTNKNIYAQRQYVDNSFNPENLGNAIFNNLSIKATPSDDDEFVIYDSITTEAVTVKYEDIKVKTGFETAFLNTTQSITASTDTVVTITGATQTENGTVDLLDLTNNVITPEAVNDVLAIDLAIPFTTPSGTNNYVSLILRVKTTGQVYRAITHSMLKGSGNQDYLTGSWTIPINADAQTNGLELIVNSNVNFTIDSKFLSVTRIHKAQ